MFYKLDLNDFFDKEYEELNNSNGIGGMGFITSLQSIHLYNDFGIDKKTNVEFLGIGDHIDLTNKVFKEIFDIDTNLVDRYLYELISIKYWNSPYFKIIAMYFPKIISLNEYKYLVDLQYYYKEVFDKYNITVAAYEFGNNVIEYGPDVETRNNLDPIIKYGKDRLDINLKRKIREKKLEY